MSETSLVTRVTPRATEAQVADRLLDATVALVERWGIAKTTMGDIAREAGCSRATAYRVYGTKPAVMMAAAHREMAGFLAGLAERVDAAGSLEDALVIGTVESHRFLSQHRALQFVLAHEPGLVLPFLGFGAIDTLYAEIRRFGAPHLFRFLDADQAGWAAEWVARLVLSDVFQPSGAQTLGDPERARALVRRFVLPSFPRSPQGDPP